MPIATFTYEQIKKFNEGIEYTERVYSRAAQTSGVKGSMITSLRKIWTLIKDNKGATLDFAGQNYRKRLSSGLHKWFTKYENGVLHYDTGRYNDGWAVELVPSLFIEYDTSVYAEWETKQKESPAKERIEVCVAYYDAEGHYFSNIRQRYKDSGLITEKDYRRITENKYAAKVLEAHHAEPKYNVGDRVFLRANSPSVRGTAGNYHRAPNGAIVLSNTETVISAAKGAKRYKLLPFGHTTPFHAEERQLKKRK